MESYWIEDTTKLWIKIPSIQADSVCNIFVQKKGSETPSGDDTFVFFDDFPGTELDTDKWTFDDSNGGVSSITDGTLSIKSTTYRGSYSITSNSTYDFDCTDKILETTIAITNASTYYRGVTLYFYQDATNYTYRGIQSDHNYNNGNRLAVNVAGSLTYNQDSFYMNSSTAQDWYLFNDGINTTGSIMGTTGGESIMTQVKVNTGDVGVKISGGDDYGGTNGGILISSLRVREYSDNEPTITVIDMSTYYKVEIDNTGGDALTDYQISADASDFGGLSNDESLEISDVIPETSAIMMGACF